MRDGSVRGCPLEGQVVDYASNQRLELWVRSSGLLDGFCVYLGGVLFEGADDGRIHAYPIERCHELRALIVRFRGSQGGVTSIVDVSSEARKVHERNDHSYLVRAV